MLKLPIYLFVFIEFVVDAAPPFTQLHSALRDECIRGSRTPFYKNNESDFLFDFTLNINSANNS